MNQIISRYPCIVPFCHWYYDEVPSTDNTLTVARLASDDTVEALRHAVIMAPLIYQARRTEEQLRNHLENHHPWYRPILAIRLWNFKRRMGIK